MNVLCNLKYSFQEIVDNWYDNQIKLSSIVLKQRIFLFFWRKLCVPKYLLQKEACDGVDTFTEHAIIHGV